MGKITETATDKSKRSKSTVRNKLQNMIKTQYNIMDNY